MNSIRWGGVRLRTKIKDKEVTLSLKDTTLKMTDFETRSVVLNAVKFGVVSKTIGMDDDDLGEWIEGENLEIHFKLDFTNAQVARRQVQDLFNHLNDFFIQGETELPIKFSGTSYFGIQNKPYRATIKIESEQGKNRLVMDPTDIRKISDNLQEKLTDAEVELLAKNPAKAPRLLQIRDESHYSARHETRKDKTLSFDAYRYVLWSYLLTKEYGDEFSQEVTHAHELGSANKKLESEMDYKNAAVGRRYANTGYTLSSIKDRIKTDPEVVLSLEPKVILEGKAPVNPTPTAIAD